MSFDQCRVEFQRFSRRYSHLGPIFLRDSAYKYCPEPAVGLGQSQVTEGMPWIFAKGLVKVADAFLHISLVVDSGQRESALEVTLVHPRVDGANACKLVPFLPRETDFYFVSNGLRNIALQVDNISYFPIIGFGPEVLFRCCPNQLCVNANSATLPHYRSLDDRIHTKGFGNFRRREVRGFEPHHRCSRNDTQVPDGSETPDEFLGHSIGKVLLPRIPRDIL